MSTSTMAAPASTVAARPAFKTKYDHYINGAWAAPSSGEYFDNISPIDGKVFTQAARGNAKDIDKAIDAATEAFKTWGKTAAKAVYNSAVLENVAQMALLTEQINPNAPRLKDALIRKHFERKHGPDSYYGQV